jgi:hypothetical protein
MSYNIKDELEQGIRILDAYEMQLGLSSMLDEPLSRDAAAALLSDARKLTAGYREALATMMAMYALVVSKNNMGVTEHSLVEGLNFQFNTNL